MIFFEIYYILECIYFGFIALVVLQIEEWEHLDFDKTKSPTEVRGNDGIFTRFNHLLKHPCI
jgi:hypothetical protein